MDKTMTLRGPSEIPTAVGVSLGFMPSDSLVVLGLGGGPSARVDISPDGISDAVGALSTVARHWTSGVVVAVYSETVDLFDVAVHFVTTMPDVDVKIAVKVLPDGTVIDNEGQRHTSIVPDDMPDEARAKRVVSSRAELIAEADEITDADTAWTLARESYFAGNGARAWVYVDRFVALNGEDTVDSLILRRLLTEAVDPRSDAARAL